ncbi:MAG: potassium transporter TrkG [Pseudomonadota bacterium]
MGKHSPVYVLLFGPPAVWALIDGEHLFGSVLLAACALALTAQLAVRRHALPKDLRRIEALATVALVFLIAALLSVPAFMTVGMSVPDAFFEAMSGITTTGLSVAADPDAWPFAVHVFRSWLQWVGGLVMATAVLALILPSGLPTMRLGRVGISEGDRIASTRLQARQLLVAYSGLTIFVTALTLLVIEDWREALVLSLSGVSTGGFAPRSDSLASYTLQAQITVMAGCLLGSVSLLTFVLVSQGKLRKAWDLGSLKRVGAMAVGASVIVVGLLYAGGERSSDAFADGALNVISALTTAGYSTSPMPASGAALLVFVCVMLIGADNGSTGGGLKLSRVSVAFTALRHAVRTPMLPDRAVAPLRSKGGLVEDNALIGLIALGLIYAMALGLLCLHFLVHGYPAGPALFDSVSTLSTVGLSMGLVGADMPTDLKLTLALGMWLGRLEFIAVIVLALPMTWRNRRT